MRSTTDRIASARFAPLLVALALAAAATAQTDLRDATARIAAIFNDRDLESWGLTIRSVRVREKKRDQPVRIDIDRYADGEVRIEVTSPWISGLYVRPGDGSPLRIEIPHHGMVFTTGAAGELTERTDQHLAPTDFVRRLLGRKAGVPMSLLNALPAMVGSGRGPTDLPMLGVRLRLEDDGELLLEKAGGGEISNDAPWLRLQARAARTTRTDPADLRRVPVVRAELERSIFRGIRRGAQLLVPKLFAIPMPKPRRIDHGEIRIVTSEGAAHPQVVTLLHGTPEQIGKAHGTLLTPFVERTVDSAVHFVGLVESLRRGRWFLDVLREARARTAPHVPEHHDRELRALAASIPGVPEEDVILANIFPEYFHCSGFALFGKATVDGELYHGRVLDYMTGIGLQDAAVTFVVESSEARHRFVNVGFAGFIGSVTGLNECQVAIGEMGGGGRGKWDGVPMATLVRRGLEECATIAELSTLFERSPRTCEYYYVFSDGKGPTACGVSATPESIEFLDPGAPHPELGEGIEDCVLLSADDRLVTLQQRVQRSFGTLDATASIELMTRPVAMKTNLHNVLFAPRLQKLWITVAGTDGEPAADRAPVELDAATLFDALRAHASPPADGSGSGN